MFYLFLKQELLIFKNNWMRQLLVLLFFPTVLYLTISIPMYNVLPNLTLNYLYWSIPGISIIVSMIISIEQSINRIEQFLSADGKNKIILNSPNSILMIVMNIYIYSIIIGLIQSIISICILNIINWGIYTFFQHFLLLFQILVLLSFFSSIGIFMGFIFFNFKISSFILIIFYSTIGFIGGALLPLELFSEKMSLILLKIPVINVILNAQNIYSLNDVNFLAVIFTLIISFLIQVVNVIIAYKSLRR